jgi:hypothetical protein
MKDCIIDCFNQRLLEQTVLVNSAAGMFYTAIVGASLTNSQYSL